VNHHAGSASPPLGDEPAVRAVFMVETTWFSHRELWHLVCGGALRRHPELKLVLTEQGSGWIQGCSTCWTTTTAVGGNAARVYGFDLDLPDPIAAKVGPTVAEPTQPLTEPPADATSPALARGASVRVW
jgi:hypothetical protein